jgi:hypothetical protein
MSERVVTLLDGTRYVFPEGTPERVINRAMIRQRNRQQREQRYQERQQARETADQYRAGRERIMGSELPADDTGAIRDVRQYLSERQLAEDIGAESAAMRAEEIAGPRDIGRERFMSASQGLSLGSAPFLQGGITGIAGALAYPFMGEEAREGRSYPQFISEMTSRGYQRARTDIDRAREDRPIETLALEAAGGFGTGKTIYDRAASRYFPNRPGVAGATVGAGTGAQYGFLDTEGDPEMTALGAGLGGPFGAGVAKALQAAAGPVGRMFRGEPAQVPEPEPELPAGEYLRRRSMRAGSPVMGERTQQLRADWEPVTADLTGASTTAQSAARATEAATQARTPDALSAALAAKRALRTKIEGIVEARAGANTPEDQRLADALEALSQDTRDPVQLGTQVSVARNNLDRVLEGLGQGREGNLSPVPTRPPVRRTFSPEEEARTIPDEAGRPSRTRYAEGEEAQWNTNQTFFIGSPNKNIENFEIRTTTGRIGQGVYATPQRQLAEGYTKSAGTYLPNKRGGKVYEVYIRGKLASEEEFYEALRGAQAASDMNQRKFSSIDELEKANQKIERDAQRILKERGFTGFLRRHDADGQNFEADEVIVFDPANVRRVDDPRFKKNAETPDDTQMGLSGNATLTNAFAGGAIGAVAPAESAEERARNVALGVGLGAGASRLGLRAGGTRGMGVGADDVPSEEMNLRNLQADQIDLGGTLGEQNAFNRLGPQRSGDGGGGDQSRSLAPLEGAPRNLQGPIPELVSVAERYARANNIPLKRQTEYAQVNPERGARIAKAYEEMQHAPNDPAVREAYADLIRQTRAQYEALVNDGYKFAFFDSASDPYGGNPSAAMRDLRNNKRMAVYGTYDGYGTEGITAGALADNPMLADMGLQWPDQSGVMRPVTANDLFRAVHDAFGHGLEGAGFRARGEENAWQAHVRLFNGPAVGALTSETRGQNSWLNFGPYGEANRNAALEKTVFAEQKTGLMPEWTWTEARLAAAPFAIGGAALGAGATDD